MPTFKTATEFDSFANAVAVVHGARLQALRNVFEGAELHSAMLRKAQHANAIRKDVAFAKKEATGLAGKLTEEPAQRIRDKLQESVQSIRERALKLITEMFGAETLAEVVEFLSFDVVEHIADIVTEVVPYLGIAKSGSSVAIDLLKMGKRGVELIQIERGRRGFAQGDAQSALRALERLVAVEMARAEVDLFADSAALGGKVGGLFADLGIATGPAIGLLRAIVRLVKRVMIAALDHREMVAGNKRLAMPATLDRTVFEECPLLACYFLVCASDSDLLNFLSAEIGTKGFVLKVEALKKQIDSSRNLAAAAVGSSRFVLYRHGLEVVPQGMENSTAVRQKRQVARYAANFKRQVLSALPGRG